VRALLEAYRTGYIDGYDPFVQQIIVKHLFARFYGISPANVNDMLDVEVQALLYLISEDLERSRIDVNVAIKGEDLKK